MPGDQRLQELLAELRQQLAASQTVDAQLRERLESTLADTERALAGDRPRHPQSGSLAGRLGEVAVGFEASHPTLAGTLGSIIDALGRMGI